MKVKKILCFCLAVLQFSALLFLPGCNWIKIGTGELRYHTEKYDILVREGKWYIYLSDDMFQWCQEMFNNEAKGGDTILTPDGDVYKRTRNYLRFESVQAMRDALISGEIPRDLIYNWTRKSNPIDLVREREMLNLDALCVPVLPADLTVGGVVLKYPDEYEVGIKRTLSTDASVFEHTTFYSIVFSLKDQYKKQLEDKYIDAFDDLEEKYVRGYDGGKLHSDEIDPVTGVRTLRGRSGQIADVMTHVRYAINSNEPGYFVKRSDPDVEDNGTLYVVMKYYGPEFDSLAFTEILGSCSVGGFYIWIYKCYPKERNVEWLSQFGTIPLSEYEATMDGTD